MLAFVFGLLVAVAALLYLRGLSGRARSRRLTDEAIRQIEAEGRVDVDDPLDLREIEAEERRFWEEERWDESEEW